MPRESARRAAVLLAASCGFAVFVWWLWPAGERTGSMERAWQEVETPRASRVPPARRDRGGMRDAPAGQPSRASDDPDGRLIPPGAWRRRHPDACDDGDPCTRRDRLTGGECRGDPFECDDGNALTSDECTGEGCLFRPLPGVVRPAIE